MGGHCNRAGKVERRPRLPYMPVTWRAAKAVVRPVIPRNGIARRLRQRLPTAPAVAALREYEPPADQPSAGAGSVQPAWDWPVWDWM